MSPFPARTLLLALSMLLVAGCTDSAGSTGDDESAPASAAVCGATRPGPTRPPAGTVTVDPSKVGDLSAKTEANPPGTTFWLAPGRHRLPAEEFAQVQPKQGNTFLGSPGAVLDGAGVNRYAFTGEAEDVTIRHVTVRGFVPPMNEGVVNHDSGAGWTIEHSTLMLNDGAAMMAGNRQVMRSNCLRGNGQYGLNACCGNIGDLLLVGNEFVGNHTDDLERRYPGCGCTGAMKFWEVNGADIRGNWIHDNNGPGIWADTNNNDFLIERNLIEGNDSAAVFYETSYNAIIRDNTIRRNNLVEGREFADRGDNFPTAAIYVSESGGEPRISARTDRIDIYRNDLTNNWSGITLWENADRFCNSPANTSTDICTLLVDDVSRCRRPGITSAPLLEDCRWKTQRVNIRDNRFTVDPKAIGCEVGCARMAVLSNYGTSPTWSPYKADVVQQAITFRQENRWSDNTYVGPWTFTPFDANGRVESSGWQGAQYKQDRGSTFTAMGNS